MQRPAIVPAGIGALVVVALVIGVVALLGMAGEAQEPWGNAPGFVATTAGNPGTSTPMPTGFTRAEQVDVLIYGTTTSGLGAMYALCQWAERNHKPLSVALVSVMDDLESPLAQGLCIEDEYEPSTTGGFYGQFRRTVASYYEARGIWPFERSGRLTYEPEVARRVLCELVFGQEHVPAKTLQIGPVSIKRVQGIIQRAYGGDDGGWVEVAEDASTTVSIKALYLIDASVEADLARALGCSYYMGRCAEVYNDRYGLRPGRPHSKDLYALSPQSLGYLPTLISSQSGVSLRVKDLPDWAAAQTAMGGKWAVPQEALERFQRSWSMRHMLPGSKHELNEPWGDWADPDIIVRWYQEPGTRIQLAQQVKQRMLVLLAQVQEYHPRVGLWWLPEWPYVRGEVMVLGDRLHGVKDITGPVEEPIATGVYALFDRHDPVHGSLQPDESAKVRLPLSATRPAGQPRLLVSTAYSLDWRAYNSACRMEPMRAAVGAACGTQVALAFSRGVAVQQVTYTELLSELRDMGEKPIR